MGVPSRSSGTPSMVRMPPIFAASVNVNSGSARTSGICTALPSTTVRPVTVPRPSGTGLCIHEFDQFGRIAVARQLLDKPVLWRRRIAAMSASHSRAADCGQRVEHRLQVERRAADHLEHVGGGGLLLQEISSRAAR